MIYLFFLLAIGLLVEIGFMGKRFRGLIVILFIF